MTNKLYAQYKGKSKAEAMANIPLEFREKLVSVAGDIRDMWDIDNNSGEQLNVIGRIVDQDRNYISTITFDVYECNGDGDFECGDSEVQCSTLTASDNSDLSNEYYRLLLKSKIVRNNSPATIDDILTAVKYIAPDVNFTRLIDAEDMSFYIELYNLDNEVVRDLILNGKIVPTPQGVRFSGFLESDDLVEFNSDGDFECGDESAQCVGYIGVY